MTITSIYPAHLAMLSAPVRGLKQKGDLGISHRIAVGPACDSWGRMMLLNFLQSKIFSADRVFE